MIGPLLTFLAVGVIVVVAVSLAVSVVSTLLGLTLSIAGFLLFKAAPIMILGWLVLKIVDKLRGVRRLPGGRRQLGRWSR